MHACPETSTVVCQHQTKPGSDKHTVPASSKRTQGSQNRIHQLIRLRLLLPFAISLLTIIICLAVAFGRRYSASEYSVRAVTIPVLLCD